MTADFPVESVALDFISRWHETQEKSPRPLPANRIGEKDESKLTEAAASLIVPPPFARDPTSLAPKGRRFGMFDRCRVEFRDPVRVRDELAHCWYAQAERRAKDSCWSEFRATMFAHLRKTQNADGSWPVDPTSDPVRAAAVWCTILQLESGRHPALNLEGIRVD